MSAPIHLTDLKVFPLAERRSMARLEEILFDPHSTPQPTSEFNLSRIKTCAGEIHRAREKGSSVMLIYGAHLIKNGGAKLLIELIQQKWITHLATNGAGIIHDWEFAFAGVSTESVRENVANGTFGTWEETGCAINLAALSAGVTGSGLGESLGKFVWQDGTTLVTPIELEAEIKLRPSDDLAPGWAEMARAMRIHRLHGGRHVVEHPHKETCVVAQAFRIGVPFTVHPGIGYDIFTNHPMFNGGAIGRAAEVDFRIFGGAVENLDDGVVLSVGSAIMGPQVFEKSLSCVNNLRLQSSRKIVAGHSFYVVDLQDGGKWDWRQGEPPKDNPAYYLRFCKSFARMGGTMQYLQIDNVQFLHHLLCELNTLKS